MYFVDKDKLALKIKYLNHLLRIMKQINQIIMHLNVLRKC